MQWYEIKKFDGKKIPKAEINNQILSICPLKI
jgi:hypothetical protein